MITTAETGRITLRLENTYDRTITRLVLTQVSSTIFTALNNYRDQVTIEPGESQELSWMVDIDNATYRKLIMFRAHVTSRYPYPRQDGYCGIFVLDTQAFTGKQILTFLIVLGTVGMGLGAFGWIRASKPLIGKKMNIARALVAMIIILFFAVLCGYLKMWLFGGLLILLATLLIISAVPMYVIGYSFAE